MTKSLADELEKWANHEEYKNFGHTTPEITQIKNISEKVRALESAYDASVADKEELRTIIQGRIESWSKHDGEYAKGIVYGLELAWQLLEAAPKDSTGATG